jgi:hypothetical protein
MMSLWSFALWGHNLEEVVARLWRGWDLLEEFENTDGVSLVDDEFGS